MIAVARDEAFHFTYPENLELLEAAGAEIAFFSPLHDDRLPPRTAGVMLSGGFPELYAADLAANGPLHAALRERTRRANADLRGMRRPDVPDRGHRRRPGRDHPMAGLLPGRSTMSGRLTLGYRLGRAAQRLVAVQGGGDDSGSRVPLFVLGRPTGRPPCCPRSDRPRWRCYRQARRCVPAELVGVVRASPLRRPAGAAVSIRRRMPELEILAARSAREGPG